MFLTIVLAVSAFAALFYVFLISNFNYWKKLGIKSPKPIPFAGNYPSMVTQKRHMAYELQDLYEQYKHSDNFVGIFSCRSPQLLITYNDLVQEIYTRDFKNFHDNELSLMVDDKSDFIFANNPLNQTGEKWKDKRAEIRPGLTINRVKSVFPVTNSVCKRMKEYIDQQIKIGANEGIDAKDLSLRFTCEVVTDCVLGLDAHSFSEKPSPILAMIHKMFEQSIWFIFYFIGLGLYPPLVHIWKATFIPKNIAKFFENLMQDSINLRKAQKVQNINEDRVDFLNHMMQLQEKKNLTTMQLTANTMTFLLDGFNTTAGVLSHTLLLLGRDLERQQKLRLEIFEKAGLKNNFETIMDLPYLDACIHECIRLFPPGYAASKLCTASTEMFNKDGTSFILPKGSVVILPLYAIMMDADFYTNPHNFEPERFLEENGGLKKYKDLNAYYGFGAGPRTCIGMRFALAQLKAALVEILRHYEVRINPKTRNDNQFDPAYFLARLNGGIWLDFKKIE